MSVSVRDSKRRRIIRFKPELKPEFQSKLELEMEQEGPLNNAYYPPRTTCRHGLIY